jgi:acetyl-CoA carboxylase biotin carboxyl carrier protein
LYVLRAEVLYELAPIDAGQAADEEAAGGSEAGLVLRAPQTGRFYHRPSPDEPPYAEVGGVLDAGQAIGLLEVMKTFSQVTYEAKGGLPTRARLVRWLVEDGAEIRSGDALLEVEPC